MSRVTFSEANHTYRLKGMRYPIPSVSRLKAMAFPANWEDRAVRLTAEWAANNIDQLAPLDPQTRAAEIEKGGSESRWAAANFGRAVHTYAEQLWTGEPIEIPEEYVPFIQGLAEWWQREDVKCVDAETIVWSEQDDEWGLCAYAGRFDLLIEHPRRGFGLLDLKTGSRPAIPENGMQLAAYAGADWRVAPDGADAANYARIDWLGVLHVGLHSSTLYLLSEEDRRAGWDLVNAARALKYLPKPELIEAIA